MNKVEISGTLTKDPQIYSNDRGVMGIINLKIEKPDREGKFFFYSAKAIDDVADELDGFSKGDDIEIIGQLTENSWMKDDKWNNTPQIIITEVVTKQSVATDDDEDEEAVW